MIGALDEKENLTDLGWCSKSCTINVPTLFIPTCIMTDFPACFLFDLFQLGKLLSILPVDPKLGKMLIMGAIFGCFDPILTIVSGLSVRDPFLLPQDKKDVSIRTHG